MTRCSALVRRAREAHHLVVPLHVDPAHLGAERGARAVEHVVLDSNPNPNVLKRIVRSAFSYSFLPLAER